MNESSNKRGVMVGVFVIVGLVFLASGVLVIGNLHETFSRKIALVTVLDDVSGLQTGNNIWFSGVKIGTVKNIQFYGKSDVKVVMRIDKKVKPYIRRDAKVKIGTDGLIGNKIIVIYGGTTEAGEVTEGDTLGVSETLSTENMMQTLQESNKNLLDISTDLKSVSKKISSGEGSLGKLLYDDTLFRRINSAAASMQVAGERAERIMGELSEFSKKLNHKGNLLSDLASDTVLYKSIKSSAFSLREASDSASALISSIRRSAAGNRSPAGVLLSDEETGSHLKTIIANLDKSSKKLEEDLEGVQHSFLLRRYFRKMEKNK